MRALLFGLMALAPASAMACIGAESDIGDAVAYDLAAIDAALPNAAISGDLRADLVRRRAESGRLYREGVALREKVADQEREPALSGINKQAAAEDLAQGIMTALSIPIPLAPASIGGPGCSAGPSARTGTGQ